MVHLSDRLEAVSELVTARGVLADVGTDHGYVPISLLQRGKIRSAIAMDINKGPLLRAQEHIALCQLEDQIELRLSDGVAALAEGEATSILVAGMGGELVLHILTDGETVCRSAKELILQPQSDIYKVREYLRTHRYQIVEEDMVFEEDKYYPMMRVLPVSEEEEQEIDQENLAVYDTYGPILVKTGHPILRKYLVKENKTLEEILNNLKALKSTEAILTRIAEVEYKLRLNETAYTEMGEK